MYDVAKSNLQSEINQIENIAITHDMWTSANTESYGTTTCHYITDTWEMKGVVLETKKMDGHHSSEKICPMNLNLLVRLGIFLNRGHV